MSPASSTDGAGNLSTNLSEFVFSVNTDHSTSASKVHSEKLATFKTAEVGSTTERTSDCLDNDGRFTLTDSANVQSTTVRMLTDIEAGWAAQIVGNTYRRTLTSVPVIVTTDDEDLDKVTHTRKFEFLCRSTNDVSSTSAAAAAAVSVNPLACVVADTDDPINRTQSTRRRGNAGLTTKSVPDFRYLQGTPGKSLNPSLLMSSSDSRTGSKYSATAMSTTPMTNTVAVLSRSQSLEAVRLHLQQRTNRHNKDVTSSPGESHI
jgi:hypothetical protein